MAANGDERRLSKSRSATSVVAGSVSQLRRLWDRKIGGGAPAAAAAASPPTAAKTSKLQQLRGIKTKNEKQKEANAKQMSGLCVSEADRQGIIGRKLSYACAPLQRNIGQMCERGSNSDSDSVASQPLHRTQAPPPTSNRAQLRKDASGQTQRGASEAGVVPANSADRSLEVNVKVERGSSKHFVNGDTGPGRVARKERSQVATGSRPLHASVTSLPSSAPPCVSGSGVNQAPAFSNWYADAQTNVTSADQSEESSSPLIGQSMTLTRHHSHKKKQEQLQKQQDAQSALHDKFRTNFRPPLERSRSEGHAPAKPDVNEPVSIEDFRDMSLDSLVEFLREKSAQLSRAHPVPPSRRCERDVRLTSISEGGPASQHAHLSRSNFELRSRPLAPVASSAAGAFADSSPSSSFSDSSDATPTDDKPNPFLSPHPQPRDVIMAPFASSAGAPIYSCSSSDASATMTTSAQYDVDDAASFDREYVERKYEEMKYWTLQRRRKPKLGTSGSSSTIADAMTSQSLAASTRLGQSEVRVGVRGVVESGCECGRWLMVDGRVTSKDAVWASFIRTL